MFRRSHSSLALFSVSNSLFFAAFSPVPASQQTLLTRKYQQDFHKLCHNFVNRNHHQNQKQKQKNEPNNNNSNGDSSTLSSNTMTSSKQLADHIKLIRRTASTTDEAFLRDLDVRTIREICCKHLIESSSSNREAGSSGSKRRRFVCNDTEALLLLTSIVREKILFELRNGSCVEHVPKSFRDNFERMIQHNNINKTKKNQSQKENNQKEQAEQEQEQEEIENIKKEQERIQKKNNSNNENKNSLSTEEKLLIRYVNRNHLLSDAISIAWTLKITSIGGSAGGGGFHSKEVKKFLSAVLMLAEFVAKPQLEKLKDLIIVSNTTGTSSSSSSSSDPHQQNKKNNNNNPLLLHQRCHAVTQQLVNHFGGLHDVSKLLVCVANDWIPCFDTSRNDENHSVDENTSSQNQHRSPSSSSSSSSSLNMREIDVLENLVKTSILCWEFGQKRATQNTNSNNNINNKNDSSDKKNGKDHHQHSFTNPQQLLEDLMLLNVTLVRHHIPWKGTQRFTRYMICTMNIDTNTSTVATTKNKEQQKQDNRPNEGNSLQVQSSSASSFRRRYRDYLDSKYFERNPRLVARLAFLVASTNLMNGSLVRGIADLHFKLFIVPMSKSRDRNSASSMTNSKNNNNNKRRQQYSGAIDQRDNLSIKRSIDIMKSKLDNSGIIDKKLALAELTFEDIIVFRHVSWRDQQEGGEGKGSHKVSTSSSSSSSNLLAAGIEDDNVVKHHHDSDDQDGDSDDNMLSSRFPSLDPKSVVTTKQIDLKRASLSASWGLIVDGLGHIKVPPHLAIQSGNQNPFYQNVVYPTQQLGCELRLMAIDGSPIQCLNDVKNKLSGVVKVRLTVSVVTKK